MEEIKVIIPKELRFSLFNSRLSNIPKLVEQLYVDEEITIWLSINMFPYISVIDNKTSEILSLGLKAYDRFKDTNLLYWTIHSWNDTIDEYLHSKILKEDLNMFEQRYNKHLKILLQI